jgi:hypothetical protein
VDPREHSSLLWCLGMVEINNKQRTETIMFNPLLINELIEPDFDALADELWTAQQGEQPDAQDYQFRRLARWHDRTWAE